MPCSFFKTKLQSKVTIGNKGGSGLMNRYTKPPEKEETIIM